MKHKVTLVLAITLLCVALIGGGFAGSVLLLTNQTQKNHASGVVTRGLVCEVVRHLHLPSEGCP